VNTAHRQDCAQSAANPVGRSARYLRLCAGVDSPCLRYGVDVTQRPLWLRLADLLMFVIAGIIALGVALNAASADRWPVRVVIVVVALWLAVMCVRITPGLMRDWRKSGTAD
jgi:hypothetical protein